ncbi:FHA domain-containing protein [Streptomyces sp. NBRC 110611]|nr:FHA domain-containing protein [Streptomyces sp. NBRC 110611]
MTATALPDRQIGLFVFAFLSAGLLVYGTHRRLRAVHSAWLPLPRVGHKLPGMGQMPMTAFAVRK